MAIFYKDSFQKSYKKRIAVKKKLIARLRERIELFEINPQNPVLKTHKLTGEKEGLYAFSITGDV